MLFQWLLRATKCNVSYLFEHKAQKDCRKLDLERFLGRWRCHLHKTTFHKKPENDPQIFLLIPVHPPLL